MWEDKETTAPDPSVAPDGEQPSALARTDSITDIEETHKQFGKIQIMTMPELMETRFRVRPAVIDGLLPAGTYLLAGAPKIGKSWLALALCAALVLLWEKTVHPTEGSLLWRFVLIPISQYVLVILSGIVATFRSRGLEVYLPLIVVSLLCVAADLLLFRAIRAIGAQQRAAARAAALQSRLEEEISRASERVARLEETARLRHDLRNHLQTVEALMERGETALAEKQLAQLIERGERL